MTVHRITPPAKFGHAAQLRASEAHHDPRQSHDPRQPRHTVDAIEVDLRQVDFINGPAVLWCATYLLLARRACYSAELLVPENLGVAQHLSHVGLYGLLRGAGVQVDTTGIQPRIAGDRTIQAITTFATARDAEALTETVADRPAWREIPENLRSLAIEVLAELTANVVQHADSPMGGSALIELDSKGAIHIVVADGGIGVRAALARNPDHKQAARYDWTALERAVRERVSGTGDPVRGIGLFTIATDIQAGLGRQLFLHSGIGALRVGAQGQFTALRQPLFPGTLAHASIPTRPAA